MRRRLLVWAALLGGALCPRDLPADTIYINSPLVTNPSIVGSVGNAKYRLSQTNFDQSLDNGNAPVTAADQVVLNLGNNTSLSNRAFDFALDYTRGNGYVFRMTDTSTSNTTTVWWGTFPSPAPGTNAPTLNGESPNDPGHEYNALLLEARATRDNSSMGFSNLAFTTDPSQAQVGAFQSGTVTPATPNAGPFLGLGNGNFNQLVYSDGSLSGLTSWKLTGTLVGARDATAGGDETVRFNIGFRQVEATVVPEPSSVVLAGFGLAGFGLAGVRRLRGRRGATAAA